MIIQTCICDLCNEEIPIVKKKDMFGIEREYYRVGKIQLDHPFENIELSRTMGIHLCEKCAAQVSLDIMKRKTEILLEASKNAK